MKGLSTTINFIDRLIHHRVCLLRKLTGFYCPGCGGTRSLRFLLNGDIVNSFIYHPAVPYLALLGILLVLQLLINRFTSRRVRLLRPLWGYILIGVILINWAVKDVLLLFGTDLLSIPLRNI